MNRYFILLLIFTNIIIFACLKPKNYEKINENTIKIEAKNEKDNTVELSVNYENGAIIEIKNEENIVWTFRKHNQHIRINWFDDFSGLIIYDDPILLENANMIETIRNENIYVTQVAEANVKNIDFYHWIKIYTDNNINGWIFFGKYDYNFSRFRTPYFNNRWEILEIIENNNGVWTIRKLDGGISIIPFTGDIFEFTVHNEPGFDSEIIEILNPRENNTSQINLDIIAATEELDTIEGIDFKITDRWLKINYGELEGWIFGGYTSVMRGGPKYWLPDEIVTWRIIDLIDGY